MAAHRGWIGQEPNEAELRKELDDHLAGMFRQIRKVRKGFAKGNNDSLVCAGIKIKGLKKVRYFVSRHVADHVGPEANRRYISHAEREAIKWAIDKYGEDRVRGSILITTLSPCTLDSDEMPDRIGCSCDQRAKEAGLKVYSAVHDSFQSARKRKVEPTGPSQTTNRSLIMQGAHNRRLILSPAENAVKNVL